MFMKYRPCRAGWEELRAARSAGRARLHRSATYLGLHAPDSEQRDAKHALDQPLDCNRGDRDRHRRHRAVTVAHSPQLPRAEPCDRECDRDDRELADLDTEVETE